jgi:UDP-N-acetylmuramoyl-tripeptide--D-alanyl-D-alanine ligase
VITLTVARLAEIVGGRLTDISAGEAEATHVTGTVEFDSRAVTPGGIFLALPGARSDGHDFAAAAVQSGAAVVLAARPVGVPAIVVPPAPALDAHAGVLEHDVDGSGAAVLAALAPRLGRPADAAAIAALVGGPLFTANPDLAREVGADGTAINAPTAVLMAQKLFDEMALKTAN